VHGHTKVANIPNLATRPSFSLRNVSVGSGAEGGEGGELCGRNEMKSARRNKMDISNVGVKSYSALNKFLIEPNTWEWSRDVSKYQ